MNRLKALVEGQTEETFFREVLGPHLWSFGVTSEVILATTKRVKHGPVFKGGITGYRTVRSDLLRLLDDGNVTGVTTMIDFYGLPADFPGIADLPAGTCHEQVAHLERALFDDINDRRLIPYLSLHEFEAILFSSPATIATLEPAGAIRTTAEARLRTDRNAFPTPEEIDNSPETAPSKRILRAIPKYDKRLDGSLLVLEIGFDQIRVECGHFDQWVCRLEGLGPEGYSA